MTIEWLKVERNPTKGYKVDGRQLLYLRQKIETQGKKNSELKSIRDELNVQIESFEKKISDLEKTITDSKAKISDLMKIISDTETKIEEKDKKITSLEAEINNMIKKASQYKNDKDKEIRELNAKIEKLRKEIPKKPVYEVPDETVKGASCPRCGWITLEDYRTVNGQRQLIRKYCPNTFCLWTSLEESKRSIALSDEEPEEETKTTKVFKVVGTEIEEIPTLDSTIVAIIADPVQNVVWIWKGHESNIFEYAEATRQATTVKNDIIKKANARIIRVNEDEEPENFPKMEIK
ncbi:MAG: hypothetical protein ACFFD2_17660 [Promethearchaeota archaeon]